MRKTLRGKPIEIALDACFQLLERKGDTRWELDKWYSSGEYDFNVVKLYGKSTITIKRYDMNDMSNTKSKLVTSCELLPGGVIQWHNLEQLSN